MKNRAPNPEATKRKVFERCSAPMIARMRPIKSHHNGDRSSTIGRKGMKMFQIMGYLK
jgi:hypothetical protein